MITKPLLSVVIPTKDRYYNLKYLIKLLLSFKSDDIEIVIQDNTMDNQEIIEFLQEIDSKIIKYDHSKEQLPISENCDKAILNSNGKYVCFIGDDDGVTNHIIDCVKWMDNNAIEVVVPSTISYRWPDAIGTLIGSVASSILYKDFSFVAKKIDPMDTLRESLKNGFINRGKLPLLYHGIVKRSVLDKIYIKGESMTFFPGQSPDIANGVALCFVTDSYYFVDTPIIISGATATHGGGIRKMKNRCAPIESVPFLSKDAKEKWEKNIPPIWTNGTVWPESAIKSLRYMHREDLISKVNFEFQYASLAAHNLYLFSYSWRFSKNKFLMIWLFLSLFIRKYCYAFLRYFLKKFGKEYPLNLNRVYSIDTIVSANRYLMLQYPKVEIKDNL